MMLILIGVVWVVGILIGSWHAVPIAVALSLALLSTLLAAILHWRKYGWLANCPYLALLCLAVMMLGSVRYGAAAEVVDRLELTRYNDGRPVTLRGTVAAEPDVRATFAFLKIDRLERLEGEGWQPVSGALRARVEWWGEWQSGDRLQMAGRLETPPILDGFPYREYLARQGIVSTMDFPDVTLVARGQHDLAQAALVSVRRHLGETLGRALPEPQAGLAQGILLGLRGSMSEGTIDAFSRTGMTHIVAISGFNIAIVAAALSMVGRRLLRRAPAAVVVGLGVMVYTLLVGAGPSVVRAAIMGMIVILGTYFGRQSHTLTALALAGILMTLHDPLVLWDIGFQLSFLATAGLVTATLPLGGLLGRWPAPLRDGVTVTIAAQLATLPVVAVNFREVSLVALPANLLALPALPFSMLCSGLTVLGGVISPVLGSIVGWSASLFLAYQLLVVETLSRLSWASISVGELPVVWVWVYYLGLGLVLLALARPRVLLQFSAASPASDQDQGPAINRSRWLDSRWLRMAVTAALAVVVGVTWTGALTAPSESLSVAFLDVGQGDAILVQTPRHNVLIDGGPNPDTLADALGRRLPFWKRQLDLVILTHEDADHVGGLLGVLGRYEIGQVLQGQSAERSGPYSSWLRGLEEKRVSCTTAVGGQVVDLGDGIRLTVLRPGIDEVSAQSEGNDASLIVRLTCGDLSVVLTGDAGPEAQRALLDAGVPVKSDVLKVPHHGAAGSLSSEFLAAVDPQAVVISVGRHNRFGHPALSTLEQLSELRVYRTDEDGTVELTARGGTWWVRTARE